MRLRVQGTHTGAFGDMAATGRKIDIGVLDLFQIRGGMLIEHWALLDNLGMLKQLGRHSHLSRSLDLSDCRRSHATRAGTGRHLRCGGAGYLRFRFKVRLPMACHSLSKTELLAPVCVG